MMNWFFVCLVLFLCSTPFIVFIVLVGWFRHRNGGSFRLGVLKAAGVYSGLAAAVCLFMLVAYHLRLFEFPRFIPRDYVVRRDHCTVEQILGKPLPESLQIRQVRCDASFVPGPDGPLPMFYELALEARDWSAVADRLGPIGATGKKDNDVFPPEEQDVKDLETFRFEMLSRSIPRAELYEVKHKQVSSFVYLDGRTSPMLKLYISTKLPFFAESQIQ